MINFALNGQVVRLFDIKFSQGLYTGISGSAYIDSKANVGDEIEFKLDNISFKAIVTSTDIDSQSWAFGGNNPTYIAFVSSEVFLKEDKSLIKYPDGKINDVLEKVLKNYEITADFESNNSIFVDNVLQNNNLSTFNYITNICNQYGIVFYRDLREDAQLKFCNTFANKDAINVDILDKQKATIDTKPVAYVAENIVIDDNHNVLALGFNRHQADGGYKKYVEVKNGIIQSPFIGSTSDLTNFYAESLANHFQTYRNILALDGVGVVAVGDTIHIDSKKLPIDTKDWSIVQADVSITTDSQEFNKLATCEYSAIAVANNVQNLATGILDQYNLSKFVKEGFAVKGYSDDTEDATTLNDTGKYQLSIPEYYTQIDEDEVINDVAKIHLNHTPDQKHSFPLVQNSPTLIMELQDPTILGTRNTETRPAHNRKGYEQDYRLADNKHNSLNFINTGAFKHNIANPKATNSVVLESQGYRGASRSAALRLGDESYRDIHKGKKSGMSLQSQGNFYELHPNYKATIYGNRNNVDAKYQSISPVYAMVAQRLHSQDNPYHLLEAINADEYHQEIFAKSSSLTTHVQDNIAIDTTAANFIDKYTNKVTKDIYLNTEEIHTTDDEHNLQFNEVERNLTVENDIFEETQAKEINISANEAINTLYHNQKDTNIDGDLTFEEHELEQNITKGLTLAGGAMAITANELVKHAPQGVHITANKVSVNTAEQLVYGMYSVVSDESNVKDPQKPTNEVLRIYIMDKYCTDEEVAEDDKKILKDKDKIVDYIQDSVLTPLLSNSYIEAKSFKDGDDIGTPIAVEFTQDKYYEIKLTDDIEAICLKLNTLNISNNRFQSLIVGVNGEKAEDVIDGFKHHQNTLSLKPKDWRKIEVKQGKTETINDIETTVNHLVINVFEPPMMINLREDYYFAYYKANQNFGEYNNLIQRYAPLAHYYEPVGYKIAYYDHIVDDSDDFWQEYILKLAKSQNKLLKRQKPSSTIDPNITFAIHGYNVAVEDKINNKMRGYPQALEYMDSQYDITENKLMNDTPWYDVTGYFKGNIHKLSEQKASILPFDSDKESLEYNTDNENTAEGACKWNLQLEYSLNKAAGWDEKSLDDYNRIVQIAWQGNPKAPYDYSAAIAMSEFAGQKLAIVIDYLKQNGIKVNIMAHSLGNAVIMNTLKNVSTPVDQALCWEPAIANDSLSNSNRNEAVQTISNTYERYENGKLELTPTTQDYNVSYNYAAAASKADKFTIAYSNLDEMLGPIPNIPSLFKKGEIQSMTMNEAVNRMITHVLVSVSSYYFSTAKIGTSFADTTYKLIPNILAGNIDYNKYPEAQAIHEKISDKGAGLLFAIIGVASYALDSFVAQSTSTDTNGGFESIYQIANKFIYPASFFVEGNIGQKCQAFYRKWLQVYPNPNDNKPFLATNDTDMLTGESLYQNLNLREKLRHNFIPIYAYHEKDTLYDIASEVIDKLYKLTNTGVADIPQQVWDNLEDSISNIFNQNPISTVWDTSMSFVGPAVNGAGSLTTTVIDFLKGADIQAAIKNIKDNKEELLAVVFTVLMQPNSKVAPAMGYSGVDDNSEFYNTNIGSKLFQTPQEVSTLELPESTRGNYPCYYIDSDNTKHTVAYDQLTDAQKQSAKSMLCIDHSAMLYPTDDFMNYIYKGQLFGDPDLGLGFFGDYDMDEVRGNNSKYNKG